MGKYTEVYRGYTIQRENEVINIYDRNNGFVKRMESSVIKAARIKIDEIINRNR